MLPRAPEAQRAGFDRAGAVSEALDVELVRLGSGACGVIERAMGKEKREEGRVALDRVR